MSGPSRIASERTSAAIPMASPKTAASRGPVPPAVGASSTIAVVTTTGVSDTTMASKWKTLGLIAVMAATISPTRSPAMRRPADAHGHHAGGPEQARDHLVPEERAQAQPREPRQHGEEPRRVVGARHAHAEQQER